MKRVFTLIELTVIIAIMSIMSSLLITALGYAKRTSKDIACRENQANIGKTSLLYGSDNNNLLPKHWVSGNSHWTNDLSTYLGYHDQMFHVTDNGFRAKDECLGLEKNGRIAVPDVLRCPFRKEDGRVAFGWNGVVAGGYTRRDGSGKWTDYRKIRYGQCKPHTGQFFPCDPSRQMMAGDNSLQNYRDVAGDDLDDLVPEDFRHVKGEDGGANYLFMDGHVGWRSFMYTSSDKAFWEFWAVKQ